MRNVSRAEIKISDLENLKTLYDVTVDTPKVEKRLRDGLEAAKELSVTVHCKGIELRVKWPEVYPDREAIEVVLTLPDTTENKDSSTELLLEESNVDLKSINNSINAFSRAFIGSDVGCGVDVVEYAMEMVADEMSLKREKEDVNLNDTIPVHVLKYNHLLLGNEHKKEKSMVSVAKKQFLGGICYGTPGIVVALKSVDSFIMSFLNECRNLGKKGELVFQGTVNRDVLLSISKWSDDMVSNELGFVELSLTEVQVCMGGVNIFKKHVLQMP